MSIEVTTATAPAYWASYLVNGDCSAMNASEVALADAWQKQQRPWYVVDIDREQDGEPCEPRFTWSYQLHGGDCSGGEVLDYCMHKQVLDPAIRRVKALHKIMWFRIQRGGLNFADYAMSREARS